MSFTHEEVVLEKRDSGGWRKLGAARFTRGDLGQQLSVMRNAESTADGAGTAAMQDGPDTLLVIPDDQILYTTLTVPPGPEPALAVARALEGLTPYDVSDLAFDWVPAADGQADSLRVAAVALRTLEEAETFALEQGFRPTGFIARPGDDLFPGQPDFGPSETARQLGRRTTTVTVPDLRRAGITSAGIADMPDIAVVTGPIVSPVIPHRYAAAPEASLPPRQVISEFIPPAPRQHMVEPNSRPARIANTAGSDRVREPRVEGPAARQQAPAARDDGRSRVLPPRAQAIHSRAAEARALREPEAATDQQPKRLAALIKATQTLNDRMPSTFAVMMGLLVTALLLTLLFFGGADSTPETDRVAVADPAPVNEQAAAADALPQDAVSDQPVIEDTTEPAEETALAEDAPAAADPVEQAAPAEPASLPADPQRLTAAPAQTDGQQPETDAVPPARVAEEPTPPAETVATADTPVPETPPTGAADQTVAADQEAGETAPVAASVPQAATDVAATTAAAPPAAPVTAPPAEAAPSPAPLRTLALTRSTRPVSSPNRTAAPEPTDASPQVPLNPRPFAERAEPAPVRVTAIRPPSRPARPTAAASGPAAPATAAPAAAPAAATTAPASGLQRSIRPPSRPASLSMTLPEGSDDGTMQAALTADERRFLEQMLRDLRTAELGNSGLSQAERGAVILLAQARPQRRPVDVGASSQRAVDNAVAAAMSAAPPPGRRAQSEPQRTAASPTATGGLSHSNRPQRRPGTRSVPAPAPADDGAVQKALAAAISDGPLAPGAMALTALSSSPLPPRRSGNRVAALAAAATQQIAAAAPQPDAANEAAAAEQRREDAELQAQAEARARERAAADARAEAQARAAAEARARAQAQAEAQAAAARNQNYTPPEAENEPEVAVNIPRGTTAASVAAAATVKDGITVNRTQIIGTIGAGKGSRALVRLSNGRIITLRLGDRINGGTITAIGNSRITYVKGGRSSDLAVLDGR
ncbi:hypothetical protein FNJ84_06015 [Paracoccus sp. M683]|uniref:hypothetical protein n=1 Tax=Paracoccus sp. M683 TaxID=2594268 RepID=UPI001193378B|nr:hypothetical protein [Paracoccus sp. M683]TRW98332.1 hypothetical protein FNJ84_06015 [Paracoccus sp. M683]